MKKNCPVQMVEASKLISWGAATLAVKGKFKDGSGLTQED